MNLGVQNGATLRMDLGVVVENVRSLSSSTHAKEATLGIYTLVPMQDDGLRGSVLTESTARKCLDLIPTFIPQ
jgi:hypothetical protein